MKIDFRNLLPVALKKTIPAVLLLGSLSLGLATTAQAQLTLNFSENTAAGTVDVSFGGSAVVPALMDQHTNTGSGAFLYKNLSSEAVALRSEENISMVSALGFAGGGWFLSGSTWYSTVDGVFMSGPAAATGGGGYIHNRMQNSLTLYSNSAASLTTGQTLAWSGSSTFEGSLVSLGVTPGTNSFSFTKGSDVITINWTAGAAAVPEPSTYALLFGLITLGLVGARRHRRRVPNKGVNVLILRGSQKTSGLDS